MNYIPRKNRWVLAPILLFHLAACLGAGIFAAVRIDDQRRAETAIPQMTQVVKAAGWEPDAPFQLEEWPVFYVLPIYLAKEPLLVGSASFGNCTVKFTAKLTTPTKVTGTIEVDSVLHRFNPGRSTYEEFYAQRKNLGLEKCFT